MVLVGSKVEVAQQGDGIDYQSEDGRGVSRAHEPYGEKRQ